MRVRSRLAAVYDQLDGIWHSRGVNRWFAILLIGSFVGTLLLAELERTGWLTLPGILPRSHFAAVYVAFTLLLVAEILSLVFTLADSVANSVGKQFELLSLILLRKAFLEFSELAEPLQWEALTSQLLVILADGTAALLIYALIAVFFRIQRHRPITTREDDREGFVQSKKVVALSLLVACAVILIDNVLATINGQSYPYFEAVYLVFIFADILLVLISYRYSDSYHVLFRNSGFALSAVMIRLSLSAPAYLNAALGVFAVLFALGIAYAYAKLFDGRAAPVIQQTPTA